MIKFIKYVNNMKRMKTMYRNYLLLGILFLIQCNVQAREIRNINQDWEFVRMDMDFKKESDFV